MKRFNRVIALVAAMVLILVMGVLPVLANGQDKVSLCHATGSETNPYVFIVIAEPAVKAHVDKETGNLHGDKLGNQDFYADSEEDCEPKVTEPTATPTPSVSEEATPPSTVTTTASPAPTVVSLPDTATDPALNNAVLIVLGAILLLSAAWYVLRGRARLL